MSMRFEFSFGEIWCQQIYLRQILFLGKINILNQFVNSEVSTSPKIVAAFGVGIIFLIASTFTFVYIEMVRMLLAHECKRYSRIVFNATVGVDGFTNSQPAEAALMLPRTSLKQGLRRLRMRQMLSNLLLLQIDHLISLFETFFMFYLEIIP